MLAFGAISLCTEFSTGTIINGPFSAEYGDFSGLGVVHIRQRESLPDEFTARLEGGNFDTGRGFLAYSPAIQNVDSYIAYEGSYTDGPFASPGRYRRDNVNANYTRSLDDTQKLGSASSSAGTISIPPGRFRSIWWMRDSWIASAISTRQMAGA